MIYTHKKLKQEVEKIVEAFPHSFSRVMKNAKHKQILESFNLYFPQLKDPMYTIQTKIYWLMNGLVDFPKCGNSKCSNTFEHHNVIGWKIGYRKNCCPQCAKDSDERKRLYVETCMKNYGVKNISQAEVTKKKKEQRALEKYGVKNVAQADEVKRKTAKTNVERYGATTYLHSEAGQLHVKRTCNERYGTDSFSKTQLHIEKMKAANRKNYGTDWPQQNRDFMRNMHKRYEYDGINFDSSVELALYIWCKDNDIDFTYQPDVSFNYIYDNHQHTYEPDFLVDGQLIEIKGDHFFKKDGAMQNPYDHSQDSLYEAKHQCMISNNVKIIKSSNCEKYVNYVNESYGKGYLKQFKRQ